MHLRRRDKRRFRARGLLLGAPSLALFVSLAYVSGTGCEPEGDACGPARATVAVVIDGDTVELDSGERIRYLLVDTPESTSTVECYGEEATLANANLVAGQVVDLEYDQECTDRFGRLLAYVSFNGRDISQQLIEQGYGCVLHIPPNGADRVDLYRALESRAESEGRGLWGACAENPCR